MLSVVIPTMWRYRPFVSFLNNLCKLEVIDEIILINNDRDRTPWKELRITDKVVWQDPGQNIFVNPSWNKGIELALNSNVCIINDDVMVDFKLFLLMDEFMTHNKHNFGLAGIHPGDPNFNQILLTNGAIDLVAWREEWNSSSAGMRFGLGTLFFVRRENWIPIPEEMKLYYGDDWSFETMRHIGKDNYLITNCLYYSPNAQTCVDIMKEMDYNETITKEGAIYSEHIQNFYKGNQRL